MYLFKYSVIYLFVLIAATNYDHYSDVQLFGGGRIKKANDLSNKLNFHKMAIKDIVITVFFIQDITPVFPDMTKQEKDLW